MKMIAAFMRLWFYIKPSIPAPGEPVNTEGTEGTGSTVCDNDEKAKR
jgi:hypothetical protein